MSRRRLGALAAVLLAGCGTSSGPPPVVTERVGRGPQAAWIVRQDTEGPRPVVLFLHGWGATTPDYYRPWLDHLARGGATVIYPRYQDSFLTPPAQVLGNALAGIRSALGRIEPRPRDLVVAGHSAGGALAADYAAVAGPAGLPRARAVLSLYPGRRLRDVPLGIPEVAPGQIPAATRIVALGGARDSVVGTAPARRIVAAATRVPRARRTYTLIREPAVADHLGPQRTAPATRRVFWKRLDDLIRDTSRGQTP